ncbi:hypothetical protein [Xenorhabdus bovienii]|uniref:hypothetical protein n=1 Tax=Xenorhabdus bovienii TaxID=40576 RepID=UPI00237C8E70|nr:hypothetical protein [Xenorhabdus bovienii]MDE1476190.1 hypothetical protein [Xenorhabdus bovienii]MDE9429401.1 hypothetical protein [Xenorhabdus bovienii]MDE9456243.1 hypothetical protein [Xenorhabdus bovienii]MDE9484476.1 hypothetical protein [Xenorhabdus bovienii]MDE9512570.1 hypothetical protein [Xenorhabdus bovienii]
MAFNICGAWLIFSTFNLCPSIKRSQMYTALLSIKSTSCPWLIWITSLYRAHAAQSPRNKRKLDVKRTTPHPPARFGSKKYFSFKILQSEPLDRASTGSVEEIAN